MRVNKNGVSLIVLAITIAVMIIIATTIILSIRSGDIFDKAEKAKSETNISSAKDIASMAESEWIIKSKKIKEKEGVSTLKQYIEKKLRESGFVLTKNTDEKYGTVDVAEDGTIYAYPVIPEGFVASDLSSEDEPSEGLVIYEGTEKVSKDSDADTTRNQFVWVPVNNMGDFILKDGYYGGELQTYVSSGDTSEPYSKLTSDLTGEIAEYKAMKASVEKYGGFYIARYEAGLPAGKDTSTVILSDIPVSKKDATVWNAIGWGDGMTNVGTTGAVAKSRGMYTENDSFVSHLIYGVEWDAALTFISKKDEICLKDSKDIGNYGGVVKTAGDKMVNNIFDMAGNVEEWTMEANKSGKRIGRGGNYLRSGKGAPISTRAEITASNKAEYRGFRVALYLK